MRELRTCPVTGRLVLLNDGWIDVPAPRPAEPSRPCWYCDYAGPVIARFAGAARAVIVAPHPVPALGIEGDPRPTVLAGGVRRQAVGAHELVFASGVSGHADVGEGALLAALATRVADLRKDARLRTFGATRRHAPGAHPVWQVFALPTELPPSAPAGWRDAERAHGERILEDGGATALLAWAPRVPFETWVLPAQGIAHIDHAGAEIVAAVAAAVDRVRARLTVALRDPTFDLVLVDGEPWRIEVLPRLVGPAPVEVATGVPVHGVFPEAAARFLADARAR